MRNICEAVRRRDHDRVKRRSQQIYQAATLAEARQAFGRFRWNWPTAYPRLVRSLEKDLPELSCSTFIGSRGTCGRSRVPPMPSSAASWRSDAAPDPWRSLPMSKAWTGLSMPSSTASTKIGETAPSSFLHKELDDIDCAKALLIGKGHVHNPGNSQIKKGIPGCRPRASLL